MKNKLLIAGVATLSLFALASCGGKGDDYSSVREVVLSDIEAEVKTNLNLFYDETSDDHNALLINDQTGTDIIKVYVAKDPKASLFVYNYDVKGFFADHKEKSKTVTISAVSATGTIYDSEKTTFMNTLFDSTVGVKALLKDAAFADSLYESSEYTKTISVQEEYAKYVEDNNSVAYLSIVYMPVFIVHVLNTQDKLREYVLVPVCHQFTTDGKVSDVTAVDFEKYLNETDTFKIKLTQEQE